MLKVARCRPWSCKDIHSNRFVAYNLKGGDPTSGEPEGALKKGVCWFELQRAQMAQWSNRRIRLNGQGRQNSSNSLEFCPNFVQKEEGGEAVTEESLGSEEDKKPELSLQGARPKRQRKQKWSVIAKPKKKKNESSAQRWSGERYKQAEQCLLEILRSEGAVFGKPISRPRLRVAGRKHIGDTGLLDHLLKHIDGKVAPGGAERFRRWHNTDGIMEYWLESAELDGIRRDEGVQDPYWVPPSRWKPGGVFEHPASSSDMELIKEDILNMKNCCRELAELISKKKDQDDAELVEGMHKEYINWQAKTNQRLVEISSSLSGMQDMYRDLVTWKVKTEQQLVELSNSLSSMQTAKAYTHSVGPPSSERWEDWLENTSLENMQGDDIMAWLVNADPVSVELEKRSDATSAQDGHCANELVTLKQEMAAIKRDMKELLLRKPDGALPNWNRDASLTVNRQVDFENPLLLFQHMWKDIAEWRSRMEQQMEVVSNAVRSMQQGTRQLTAFSPSSAFYL